MIRQKALLLIVLICALSAMVTVSYAGTTEQGKIFFASDRDGDLEVFSMNSDGSGQTQLTWDKATDTNPSVELKSASKVAFQTNRDGNFEIYTMDASGKGQKPVKPHKADDVYPAISPDGKKIAFASNRVGGYGYDIYVMNADASGKVERLTFHKANDSRPVWSHDGGKISFVSNHVKDTKTGNKKSVEHIWVMDADGTDQKQITFNDAREDTDPAFSPKGDTITFAGRKVTQPGDVKNDNGSWGKSTGENQATKVEAYDIYTATVGGGMITQRTFDAANDSDPYFSTDGESIAFTSNRNIQMGYEIYTMTKKGLDQKPITLATGDDLAPSWGGNIYPLSRIIPTIEESQQQIPGKDIDLFINDKAWETPPGSRGSGEGKPPTLTCAESFKGKILYDSHYNHGSGSDPEIYCMNPDGSGQMQLTFNDDETWDQAPSKSPDGKWAVFMSDRDGNQNIYLMSAEGGEQAALTLFLAYDGAPVWSPDGTKIAFSSERDGNAEIYVMDAAGANQKRLTVNPGEDSDPTWSPDSKKIAFIRDYQIKVMDAADGGNEENIGVAGHYAYDTSWSPNGKKIAFSAGEGWVLLFRHLHLVNVDGGGLKDLTLGNDSVDRAPDWSPDGSTIIYDRFAGSVGQDALFQLTTVPAAGGNSTMLTSPPSWNHNPDW